MSEKSRINLLSGIPFQQAFETEIYDALPYVPASRVYLITRSDSQVHAWRDIFLLDGSCLCLSLFLEMFMGTCNTTVWQSDSRCLLYIINSTAYRRAALPFFCEEVRIIFK